MLVGSTVTQKHWIWACWLKSATFQSNNTLLWFLGLILTENMVCNERLASCQQMAVYFKLAIIVLQSSHEMQAWNVTHGRKQTGRHMNSVSVDGHAMRLCGPIHESVLLLNHSKRNYRTVPTLLIKLLWNLSVFFTESGSILCAFWSVNIL